MQRPLLHLNWLLEQEWLQPASSLLSPQSLSAERREGKGAQRAPGPPGEGWRRHSEGRKAETPARGGGWGKRGTAGLRQSTPTDRQTDRRRAMGRTFRHWLQDLNGEPPAPARPPATPWPPPTCSPGAATAPAAHKENETQKLHRSAMYLGRLGGNPAPTGAAPLRSGERSLGAVWGVEHPHTGCTRGETGLVWPIVGCRLACKES